MHKLSGIIKMEGTASAFNGGYLVRVDNVAWKQILIINLSIVLVYTFLNFTEDYLYYQLQLHTGQYIKGLILM
jgi:uncharacterized membrane protein YwzB